jgi:hypothetical protein
MHFSREALKGIYDALTEVEKLEIWDTCSNRNEEIILISGHVVDECLPTVVKVMVELGHIMPFETAPTTAGAEEYDEMLAAQALMRTMELVE